MKADEEDILIERVVHSRWGVFITLDGHVDSKDICLPLDFIILVRGLIYDSLVLTARRRINTLLSCYSFYNVNKAGLRC